jgi:ABC-type multidrug transport system fused ATPase/permease subunit
MSVDSQRLIDFFLMVNTVWSAPLQIIIASILLYQQLGIATFAGILFMIILMPITGFINKKMGSIQGIMMKDKDKRIKLMNEILNSIKVLKLYAWENSFRDRVMGHREKEVKSLNSLTYLNAAIFFTFVSAPLFVRYYLISFSNSSIKTCFVQ